MLHQGLGAVVQCGDDKRGKLCGFVSTHRSLIHTPQVQLILNRQTGVDVYVDILVKQHTALRANGIWFCSVISHNINITWLRQTVQVVVAIGRMTPVTGSRLYHVHWFYFTFLGCLWFIDIKRRCLQCAVKTTLLPYHVMGYTFLP